MSFRPFEYDPLTGVHELFDYDWETDSPIIRTFQNVDPILDVAKDLRNDCGQGWRGKDNDFWKVATIPLGLLHKWMIEDGINYMTKEGLQRIKRKLDDPEYAYLKTAPITIGRASA